MRRGGWAPTRWGGIGPWRVGVGWASDAGTGQGGASGQDGASAPGASPGPSWRAVAWRASSGALAGGRLPPAISSLGATLVIMQYGLSASLSDRAEWLSARGRDRRTGAGGPAVADGPVQSNEEKRS